MSPFANATIEPGESPPKVEVEAPSLSPAPFAPEGLRIGPVGGLNSLAISEAVVVGGNGGTWMTTVQTRVATEDFQVDVRLPFASYRTAEGRSTGLGNLSLAGWMKLDATGGFEHAAGVVVTVNPGGQPYTWVNRADDLWPGGGVDAVWQLRSTNLDQTTFIGRASLGLHGARGYTPFPKFYPRITAAGGIDHALNDQVGLVSELSLAYWDVSPLDLAALIRVDPIEGLRARGGVLLPAFTWFGWTPTGLAGGLHEATLQVDLQTAW